MAKNILHMTDEEKKQLMENLRQRFQEKGNENPFKKFRERKQKESKVVEEKPMEEEKHVEMIEENNNKE